MNPDLPNAPEAPEAPKREMDDITPEERRAWTKSAVLKQTRAILGPFARLKESAGIWTIWLEKGKMKLPLGSGSDPYEAFYRTFVLPQKAREIGIEAPPEKEAEPTSQAAASDVPDNP